ncbi:PH domain-containing protein [Parasegetibacter sp. NRK P23]|uniref:PH domain-containing protein n=1 Tax=Parasegetibacter sp. NRK P23 TaxID=2942999 RepID=UPI0020448865|nr:PH domain-containing protein [Parasegetibacter sp. NRK P23]MCM5527713.1 PH domain-containing protein [Parasegetibacter sp. NRK P23]
MGFASTMDARAKRTTLLIISLLSGALLVSLSWTFGAHFIIYPFLFIATIVLLFSLRLRKNAGLSFVHGAIMLKTPFSRRRIPLQQIKAVSELNGIELAHALHGSARFGFLGYRGLLKHDKFGRITSYATRRDNGVVLHLHNGETLLLTPDECPKFLSLLRLVKGNTLSAA